MAKKTTLDELGAMITHVVEHMATKEDIEKLDARIDGLDARIDKLDARIEKLDARVAGLKIKIDGVQNTLDNEALARADQKLPDRVTAIEKHLGIEHKIAA